MTLKKTTKKSWFFCDEFSSYRAFWMPETKGEGQIVININSNP